MILGLILGCLVPTDVRSCQVVAYEKKRFTNMAECKLEMSNVARHTANNFGVVTRPYCFDVSDNSI